MIVSKVTLFRSKSGKEGERRSDDVMASVKFVTEFCFYFSKCTGKQYEISLKVEAIPEKEYRG